MKTAINLTKEYLKLVLWQYSLAVLVWVMMIFTGSGVEWLYRTFVWGGGV